ncbi:FAD-dependent oxidoreductase [Haliea sp. E17]|uniref:FAD-dependent oxidoreductase n=1 Tax=Haliea sp. E17 TaxID=3401576 RepID=UPI003AB0D828
MQANLPESWDIEVDVVSLGSGIGGLSAAITASELGGTAVVLERSPMVGGVTALSMGEVWVVANQLASELGMPDSVEAGFRYLERLSMGYGNDLSILNLVVHAREALRYFERTIGLRMRVIDDCPDYYYGHCEHAVAAGRMIEPVPFAAQALGDWQHRTRLSPQMPYGMTHADISAGGGAANMINWDFNLMGDRLARDERCLGPGLAAYFVKGALDRGIELLTDTSAEELLTDGERIVGVRASRDGRDFFVRARRGVVVAVSSYERRQDYNRTLGQKLDLGSMVFSSIDGSNFRLAGPHGARIATVPDITTLGFVVPGEEDEEGSPLWRNALLPLGLPHTLVVNRQGRRFGNEAFYRQFNYRVDAIDGSAQTHPNFPCWLVFDSQAKDKYPIGAITPDQRWPAGFGCVADSVAELAQKLGVDADALAHTIATFNDYAAAGVDDDFGRGTHPWSAWMCGDPNNTPNPNLGPLVKPPFYAIELRRIGGTAIPSAGLLTDTDSRVMGWDDKPIAGLYAAGNSVARMETGAVMQSGISNARGMTYGWLAARHALGKPSELLAREARRLELGGAQS